MRNNFLLPHAIILALCVLPASVMIARADPLDSTASDPMMRDPSPHDSHNFPRTSANGGVADPGPEVSKVSDTSRCKTDDPCAVSPPPVAHVETPRPSPPG